jgi:tetratricopeptide (TPR) repeat protein
LNCPYCGADTKNAVTICPLCGKTLDRDSAFISYMIKGDDFMGAGDPGKAVLSYRKALEYSKGNEDVFLKLGNAYSRMNDKQAASVYMKALAFNFYNDQTHNLLITLYSRHGKLGDLKKWYEQSRAKADPEFIDRYIKIIDNIIYFKAQAGMRIPGSKSGGFAGSLASGLKKYAMFNIVGFIIMVVVSLAIFAGIVLKVNTTFLFVFSASFLFISIGILIFARLRKAGKKVRNQATLEEFMAGGMEQTQNSKPKTQDENNTTINN